MDSWIVIVSTLAGGAVAVAGTVVKSLMDDYLAHRRKNPLAEARKKLLRQMLDGQRDWRNLDTLMHVIGADAETTRQLLLEIGARGSETGEGKWGLVSRNPLPTNLI